MKIPEEEMSRIQIKSSIVLDVLCFIQKRLLDDTKWMYEKQIEEIKSINALLPNTFDDKCIGMSNMCLVISAYFDKDLDSLTLDDLIHAFKNPSKIEKTVKEKIKCGFTASYINPTLSWLNDGIADVYVENLTILKNIGFENIYNERIMPLVREEIEQKQKEVNKYNATQLFKNISILKNISMVNHTNIYVSFFSAPTAFTLYDGSFLTCFCPTGTVDFYSIVAHELMHGFASEELINLYREHVESSEYLKQCHRALIDEYHSGDEEEFVMAAEYFLCYLSGKYTKDQLILRGKKQYGGNCPTSVTIFELLCEENEPPKDFNKWLLVKFKERRFG